MLLEADLVHGQRRAQHPGTDVRDSRHLQQTLDRPVLAERPVQDRKGHVDRHEPVTHEEAFAGSVEHQRDLGATEHLRQFGTQRQPRHILAVEPPRAQPVDADPGHLVAVRVQCSQYASGRNARDAVLRTRTPVDDPTRIRDSDTVLTIVEES